MKSVTYKYALDEDGKHVCIDDVKRENKDRHEYKCLSCGGKMIARLGEKNRHHFAHVSDEGFCNGETYLHRLSKWAIKKAFDNEKNFQIAFYTDNYCIKKDECEFYDSRRCYQKKPKKIDLKQYYDTCEEECCIDDYKADLLLTHSQHKNRKPVLMEIQVKHKCTLQKRESGQKIIEIPIRKEEDIEKILSTPIQIKEHPDAKFGNVRDVDMLGYAKFYGFKRSNSSKEVLKKVGLSKFYLFESGKYLVENYLSCSDDRPLKKSVVYCISVRYSDLGNLKYSLFEMGCYALREKEGVIVRNCMFCKYHKESVNYDCEGETLCCLYKRFNTPKNPKRTNAIDCEYYKEDSNILEDIKAEYDPTMYKIKKCK